MLDVRRVLNTGSVIVKAAFELYIYIYIYIMCVCMCVCKSCLIYHIQTWLSLVLILRVDGIVSNFKNHDARLLSVVCFCVFSSQFTDMPPRRDLHRTSLVSRMEQNTPGRLYRYCCLSQTSITVIG